MSGGAREIDGPPSLISQVTEATSIVRTAHTRATTELNGRFFKTAEVKASIQALKNLEPLISSWIDRGIDGANAKRLPSGAVSWDGWTKAGIIFLEGIAEHVQDAAITTTLKSIVVSAADSVVQSPKTVKKAAKATIDAAQEAEKKIIKHIASGVGTAAWEMYKPFFVPLGIFGAGVYLLSKRVGR